jgi:uncharacterized membrane protein YdbT with pleckstrin-like domain
MEGGAEGVYQTSGERVIWRANRHWLFPASNLLLSAPLMLVVLAVVLGLVDHLGQQGWPISLLLASVVTGTWFGAPMIAWASTSMTLTTHRVIIERGVLNLARIAIPYNSVQSVDIRQNVAGRVLGYGTVELEIGTSNGPVSLTHMPLQGLHEHLVQRVLAVANSGREDGDRRAV